MANLHKNEREGRRKDQAKRDSQEWGLKHLGAALVALWGLLLLELDEVVDSEDRDGGLRREFQGFHLEIESI